MKGEKQIEITVRWQGSLIRVEHFQTEQDVVLNGKDPFVTVPVDWLGKESHTLVTMSSGIATVHLLPSMQAKWNGTITHEVVCPLKLGDEFEISVGPFEFVISCTPAQKPIMSPFVKDNDWRFGQVLGGVAIVQLLFFMLVALMPDAQKLENDLFKHPEKYRDIVVRQEKKENKRVAMLSGKKGAKAKGDEGKQGKKDLPVVDKSPKIRSAKAIEKDVKDVQREKALALVNRLGLNKEVMKASMFGSGGIVGGKNQLTGGLRGTETGDAGGTGGKGLRGKGLGGGGTAIGIGGVGSGTGKGGAGLGQVDLGGLGKGRSRVEPGNVTFEGALTREEIQRVIDRFMAQIKYCYEKEFQKAPDLEGKLVANWTISPEGDVETSSMAQNTMRNESVEKCLLRVVNRMMFPKPRGGGIVKVTYPFVFSSAGA